MVMEPAIPATTLRPSAAASVTAPSTMEYAPKSRTSANNVIPGQTSAVTPNRMARAPRKATAHQYLVRVANMMFRQAPEPTIFIPETLPTRSSRRAT
jgi:hypothetical protein